jgi:hypothetical protein
MGIHFAWVGNVTYVTLAVVALCNGYMISYVKARAEEYVDDCSVGFWLRGERVTGLLLACLCCHLPAWLWLQATVPLVTVLRRIHCAYAQLRTDEAERPSRPPAPRGIAGSIWRGQCPRGSVAYDVLVAGAIGFFVIAPWIHPFFYGTTDPLRDALSSILGHGGVC